MRVCGKTLVLFWLGVLGLAAVHAGAAGGESALSGAPRAAASAYDVWQVEEGWNPSSVSSVLQTRDGYLWVGTYHGLVRFDGVRFTSFDPVHTPGLQSSRITALFEDSRGTLWIAHETGALSQMANGEFRSVPLAHGTIEGPIECINEDERNDLWLLNEVGLLLRVRDGKSFQLPGGLATGRRAGLTRDRQGRLWVVSNGAVATLEGDELKPCPLPPESQSDFVERVAPARSGGMWMIGGGRIRKWNSGVWTADLGPQPWRTTPIRGLLESQSGSLLVGTLDDGAYLLGAGAPPRHFTHTNGLSHDWIRSVCEDYEGNLWLGTGSGLNALRPRKVRMLESPDYWQGRAILSFCQQSDGGAWIGTEGAGLYHYDQAGWSIYREGSGLSNLFVWSALETRLGELLVGTWGGGFYRRNGDRFESSGELAGLSTPVVSLYEGQTGEVWIGTISGVHRYENGRLTWSAGSAEMAFPDVRAITQTPDGAVWFGLSGGGLVRLQDGRLRQFRKADGLNSDFLQSFCVDTDGTLWIGTSDSGLGFYRHGRFGAIGADQGLPATAVCAIVDDHNGNLWLGSNRGIYRVSKAELRQCAEGTLRLVQSLNLGKSEGMASPVCSGGFQPGGCLTRQGQLWFPTAKGMAIIDPLNLEMNRTPPPVLIESLRANDRSLLGEMELRQEAARAAVNASREPWQIPAGLQRFEIRYTALSFAAPEKVRFKHRLEGLESSWNDAGAKRTAEYSYLAPGIYTFRVAACNNDGVWNESGAALTFEVLPHFWQTWWFRMLAVLAGMSAVAATVIGVMRLRVRRKLAVLERQRALERERARIARDIHDDLGASLTHITLLSQSARGEMAEGHAAVPDLDQIYHTARELTRAMDEIVWAVNPKHDTLDSLIAYLGRFGQNLLSGTGLRCRLDVPVSVPPLTLTSEIRHNVFLTCKEALHNIVKHARATEVRITIEVVPNAFVVVIADNGRGFEPARFSTGSAASDGVRAAPGNGLENMRRRMAEAGGRCEWDAAPQEGTRVRLTVPLTSSKHTTGPIS
jgi:ligand-binding sensor domain-containing protein/signal transduction histidine kinase